MKRNSLDAATLSVFLSLALVIAWDASGLDMALARLVGDAHGFPLRDAWWLAGPLHEGAKWLAWLVVLVCALGVWLPWGPLARLGFGRRLQLAATAVAAAFAVSSLKAASATSCPWDLAEFGGAARYVSHWSTAADGGAGRCFPAGHASSGFAFFGGYFAWRHADAAMARRWLVGAAAAGLTLGLVQQARGAHFMSHTLWTGWTCWLVAWALDRLPCLQGAEA